MSGELAFPRRVRRIERWVCRRLKRIEHEQRVWRIARRLLRLTHPLHNLNLEQRRLLHLGALVHDVGRCVSEADHPKRGAAMIVNASPRTLPLRKRERRALAYLTRYHRGAVPPAGKDAILRRDRDDVRALRLVLAFLRVADALDSRSLATPRRLEISRHGRTLRVDCYLATDSAKARRIYSRRKKFNLLEELLDCRVKVAVHRAARVGAAA